MGKRGTCSQCFGGLFVVFHERQTLPTDDAKRQSIWCNASAPSVLETFPFAKHLYHPRQSLENQFIKLNQSKY
jgi:hypothetical protein